MLADIKPELKQEAAEAEQELITKQPKVSQTGRIQNQTLPPSSHNSRTNNGDNSPKTDEEPLLNFGWEQIENGPLLPFIHRDLEKYVANHIVAELVYKKIEKDFTKEVLFCMAFLMEKMSQNEADTFNEINITHSDKKVVGNYFFKANEFMMKLDYVKDLVEFHQAGRSLILNKVKENNLFGFLQIAGEHQVPFVWSSYKKLVPLFYFEGQSNYLDSRSVDLTDPCKVGHLRFCCKIQKIRKDFYEKNPLKVVDFEDVRKLFPAETVFELTLPNKVNQDLLAPEVRIALLHGAEEEIQGSETTAALVSLDPPPPTQDINNNVSNTSVINDQGVHEPTNNKSDDNFSRRLILNNQQPKCSNEIKNTLEARGDNCSESDHRPVHTELKRCIEHITERTLLQKQPAPSMMDIEAKRRKTEVTVRVPRVQTTREIENSAWNHLLKSYNRSKMSEEFTVAPVTPELDIPCVSAIPRRISQDMCSPIPTSPDQITNVPYRSPRGASSPGFSQPNPVMCEAAQIVPQVTITPVTDITNQMAQQNILRTSGTYQPTSLHMQQGNGANNNNQQFQFQGQTVRAPAPIYQNIASTKHHYPSVVDRSTMPVQSSQLNQNHLTNRMPNRDQIEFWRRMQHQPVPNLHSQQQMQQFSYTPSLPQQNFRNHYVHSFATNQPNPGHHYQQQSNPTRPVVPNVNMFSNYTISQYSVQSYRSSVMVSATNRFPGQDINNNVTNPIPGLKITLEHPLGINPDPNLYATKICVIKNKYLLAIRKSLMHNSYMLNLSELVEKVLGLNPFTNQTDLMFRFKAIYYLNPVQKIMWDSVIKDKQFEFVGPFKDLFVDYSEVANWR